MVYIDRDENGQIIGVFNAPQSDKSQYISPQAPELLEFLGQSNSHEDVQTILTASDMAMVRVIEDLVNTLIDKGVILFTDLPEAAQAKLVQRKKIRHHLNSLENLMNEDEGLL
ncbi:hypothetical protein [Methylophaga sp.]|jgi:hypothetical protein|uniref:hypothetical protein n=1 Tax=Methylophaga sp. TaxID=2024840 RepID=UPI00271D01E9|nr:hypothetical protein [Methylophaga sp.]MDO8825727.1 hypothetical protein [Methylophaga sp.]